MINADKDALAKDVVERWIDFEMALSDKRRYPKLQFEHFLKTAWRYAEQVRHDKLVHEKSFLLLMVWSTSWVANANKFPKMSSMMRIVSKACYSTAMIHISRATNPLDSDRRLI